MKPCLIIRVDRLRPPPFPRPVNPVASVGLKGGSSGRGLAINEWEVSGVWRENWWLGSNKEGKGYQKWMGGEGEWEGEGKVLAVHLLFILTNCFYKKGERVI